MSSLRQRSVEVMKSRYLLSISSKMCFLSRLMVSGTYIGLFRSASSLQHKCVTISKLLYSITAEEIKP